MNKISSHLTISFFMQTCVAVGAAYALRGSGFAACGITLLERIEHLAQDKFRSSSLFQEIHKNLLPLIHQYSFTILKGHAPQAIRFLFASFAIYGIASTVGIPLTLPQMFVAAGASLAASLLCEYVKIQMKKLHQPSSKWGTQAFEEFKTPEAGKVKVFSNDEIKTILTRYNSKKEGIDFNAINPVYGKTAYDRAQKVSAVGLDRFNTVLVNMSKMFIHRILFFLSDEVEATLERKQSISKGLCEGLLKCEDVQFETFRSLYLKIIGLNLELGIASLWDEYKKNVLDEWIIERDPAVKHNRVKFDAKNELNHRRNAYAMHLSDPFGLGLKEKAEQDLKKPNYILKLDETVEDLQQAFLTRLNVDNFITLVIDEINSPDRNVEKIDKGLIQKFGMEHSKPGFGYFKETENYGLMKPTKEQENQELPFISRKEVEILLRSHLKILS